MYNLFNQFLIASSLLLTVNFRVAEACAVCFSGREETLEAFYLTTVFLTLLPLVTLSSIGYWLYQKYRKGK